MNDSRLGKISEQLLLIKHELEIMLAIAEKQDDDGAQCLRQVIGQVKAARTWLAKLESK